MVVMRRALVSPALAFTVLGLALAACSSVQDPSWTEGNILSPGNFRAGSGVIQSVGVLRKANPPQAGSAADPRASAPDPNAYRLYLHMDIGGFQSVDVDNGTFMAGEVVELTNDGRVVRVTGTSLNRLKP